MHQLEQNFTRNIVYLILISHESQVETCSIGSRSEIAFEQSRDTRSLWIVSMLNLIPIRQFEKSHGHVTGNVSFST